MLQKFKQHLEQNFPKAEGFHPFFNEALKWMLEAGGKHFRAQLLLGIVNVKNSTLLDKALNAALALEFIHTYSLIHDDLPAMDNASLRRGKQTLHKKYDETTAILVGDALNTEAFLLLSRLDLKESVKLKLIETLAFNAGLGGMIIGQAIDCYFEDQLLNLEQVEFLHIHKTARLIAAALKMGCEICELDEKECEQIYEIGLLIGLVFQIKDDIIDATLDTQEVGKPTHNDLHKNSFVKLLSLEGAKKAKDDKIALCEEKMKNLDSKLANELQILIDKYLKG
ncbi:geranyl diphosphate synthase / farnesyl diphosphate synthase [Campylobacter subantarcticus]|uniref:geranyl diphosphate synthase / farnesyl diphosphate synthase n=1 Tax=Campylobacter subantarcticus TaxID=497724 RepID=UPI00057DBADB|nr:geranyl diphosphate synthase / farnesyl diphosphate synthase [Campylobacter subantarcticus]